MKLAGHIQLDLYRDPARGKKLGF